MSLSIGYLVVMLPYAATSGIYSTPRKGDRWLDGCARQDPVAVIDRSERENASI